MAGLRDTALRGRSWIHHRVFAASNGRLLARWGGHEVLELTTRGRRSGLPRPVIVACLLHERDSFVVVASDGGAARDPDWYRNLRADPHVEVVHGGRRMSMLARTASDQERSRLWPAVTSAAPAYGRYQRSTKRRLPVVVLEPA